VQTYLQSDYTALILIGIKAFCANMIKKSLRSRELECFCFSCKIWLMLLTRFCPDSDDLLLSAST